MLGVTAENDQQAIETFRELRRTAFPDREPGMWKVKKVERIRTMRLFLLGLTVLLPGCAAAPKLPNSQTASERYSTLGYHEKWVAREFYDLGSGDAIRRLYWAQRRAQESSGTADAPAPTQLHRRYVNLPSPAYQDADGTWHEPSLHAVEIVQVWKAIPTINGGRLLLCR
jgi:hypothetical protein